MSARIVLVNGGVVEIDASLHSAKTTLSAGGGELVLFERPGGEHVFVNPRHVVLIEPGATPGRTRYETLA